MKFGLINSADFFPSLLLRYSTLLQKASHFWWNYTTNSEKYTFLLTTLTLEKKNQTFKVIFSLLHSLKMMWEIQDFLLDFSFISSLDLLSPIITANGQILCTKSNEICMRYGCLYPSLLTLLFSMSHEREALALVHYCYWFIFSNISAKYLTALQEERNITSSTSNENQWYFPSNEEQ